MLIHVLCIVPCTKLLELEGVQHLRTRVPPYLDSREPVDSEWSQSRGGES